MYRRLLIRKWYLRTAKLLSAAVCPLYFRGLQNGVGAAIEHEPVLRYLDCRTVVDIGANRGQFTLAARRCLPEAKVIAFEPLSGPADKFQAVFKEDPLVQLHVTAIGEVSGEVTIHLSRRDDSSSLLPLMPAQARLFPGTEATGTSTVRVARLDELVCRDSIEPSAFLKLDVQGYELAALKGCANLLDRFTFIYVECSFIELYKDQALAEEVIAYLRPLGFYLSGIFNLYYGSRGETVQGDFLFIRDREHGKIAGRPHNIFPHLIEREPRRDASSSKLTTSATLQ